MVDHRGFSLVDLARTIGCSREWLSRALVGKAYYEIGPREYWRKQEAAYAFLDRVEEGITAMTDAEGGLKGKHLACMAGYTEALRLSPGAREVFRGRG
jgi:hypothetical protein